MEPGERVDRESKAGSAAEALRSQFVFVVLGLVIEEPGYGYALWQRFESRFGGFLRTNSSAIYPALASLEAAGLIEEMVGTESVGARRGRSPDRHIALLRKVRVRIGRGSQSVCGAILDARRCWGNWSLRG